MPKAASDIAEASYAVDPMVIRGLVDFCLTDAGMAHACAQGPQLIPRFAAVFLDGLG